MSNPYPGLRPFRAEEAGLYFGREALAESVATRLRLAPLVVLFARSGVGKSSFLTCRLIPRLRETSTVAYLHEWGAEAPQAAIRRALAGLAADEAPQTSVPAPVPGRGDTCVALGSAAVSRHRSAHPPAGPGERPVLILDQFEDVFKLEGDREALWDELAGLVNVADPPAGILISMREEWLGAWEEAADYLPDALAALVRLAPLSDAELTRAIVRPAQVEGSRRVAPDLAPALLTDLRRPSAYGLGSAQVEPGLVQLVCRRLWEAAGDLPDGALDAALYRRLGGAERIVRDFVWGDLARAGAAFTPAERVLWVGLTRYLAVAPGVKAAVTAAGLAERLRGRDLGWAGAAVLAAALPRRGRAYLRRNPEWRGAGVTTVHIRIGRTLEQGAASGFLKRQRARPAGGEGGPAEGGAVYELAHDTLGPLLQQFAAEFECWLRKRILLLVAAPAVVAVLLPALAALWAFVGPFRALVFLLTVFGLLAATVLLTVTLLYRLAAKLALFPLVRGLAGGSLPLGRDLSPGLSPARGEGRRREGRRQ